MYYVLFFVVFVYDEVFFFEILNWFVVVVEYWCVEFDELYVDFFEKVGRVDEDEVFCCVVVGKVGDCVYVGGFVWLIEMNWLCLWFLVECGGEFFVEEEFDLFDCWIFGVEDFSLSE